MYTRLKNSLLFRLEQFMMRGPLARFAFVLILLVLLALVAGILIRLLVPGFESLGDALWWAFEHVVVPEYVDGDEGIIKRTFATALIILGSMLFAGAVIAILVEWVEAATTRMEQGLTPVALEAHFVLLGWTSRTPTILEEIMVSQRRVERFLRQRGARQLRIALLAERADAALMRELRLQLGEHWSSRQIILRSGSPLSLDDLQRVDFLHAGVIIIPAADISSAGAMDADSRTVKTLMTLEAAFEEQPPEELPLVVVELQDPRHAETLRGLYAGPMDIITGDEIIARLMVQTVRHPGLSHVYGQFLTDFSGSQIYIREEAEFVGASVQQLNYAFPKGVLLGVVRPQDDGFRAMLNPPDDLRLVTGDRIAVLASSHKDLAPPETLSDWDAPTEKPAPEFKPIARRRVLILGWNHRVPLLLREFASYPGEEFAIDIASQVSTSKREKRIAIEAFSTERLKVRHEFDYTVPAFLESIDPAGYDNVVLLSSERLKHGDESDARTILGYLLLRRLLSTGSQAPHVLVELTDADNISLFENRSGEIIVSPVIVSHMLTRVALRRELDAVFYELFSSGGNEIFFRPIAEYDLAEILPQIQDHDLTGGDYTFVDLQRAAQTRGEIAIGIRRSWHYKQS
jgi:Trk K+ transport system NAD-binding subunit